MLFRSVCWCAGKAPQTAAAAVVVAGAGSLTCVCCVGACLARSPVHSLRPTSPRWHTPHLPPLWLNEQGGRNALLSQRRGWQNGRIGNAERQRGSLVPPENPTKCAASQSQAFCCNSQHLVSLKGTLALQPYAEMTDLMTRC